MRDVERMPGRIREQGLTVPSGPRQRIMCILLVGLFIFYLSAGLILGIVLPLGEAPDEPAHFLYVRHVARNCALPVMQPDYKDNDTAEAFQAPAYYVLAALITRFAMQGEVHLFHNPAFSFGSRVPTFLPLAEHGFPWREVYLSWHIARFFSLALGAVSLWATYRAGLLVFESQWLALAATAYLAMNPQFIYLHSVVTNDALATAAGSLMSLVSLLLLRASTLRRFIMAALVISLAALGKPSALTLLPGLALALVIAWRALPSARERWLALGLLVVVPLGCSGWWFLRNQQLYGDFLGLTVAKQALAPNYYSNPLSLQQLVDLLPQMLWQTFRSSWGYFGWLAFPLPSVIFYLILFAHLPALIGLLLTLRTASLRRWVSVVLTSAWLGLMIGFLSYNRETNSAGWQGRFLFPGLSVMGLGFVAGWGYWLKHREAVFASLTVACGSLLAIYAVCVVVLPVYLPPRFLPPDVPVPHRCAASYTGGLQLVGYETKAGRVSPGSYVHVTLYWRTQHHVQRPYRFFVDGYTLHGDPIVSRTESHLSQRFPPMLWPEGQVVADRYRLQVSKELSQVIGDLTLQVVEGDEDPQPVPYTENASEMTGDRLRLGQVIIGAGAKSDKSKDSVQARFGEGEILLAGHDLSPKTVHSGETMTVTLYWQAVRQPAGSYQVFVHGFDSEGQLIAQHDGPPRMGLYPTSVWSAGETIVDHHPVQMPSTYEGTVRLHVGLHLLDSMERLPVADAQGEGHPERVVPLATALICR